MTRRSAFGVGAATRRRRDRDACARSSRSRAADPRAAPRRGPGRTRRRVAPSRSPRSALDPSAASPLRRSGERFRQRGDRSIGDRGFRGGFPFLGDVFSGGMDPARRSRVEGAGSGGGAFRDGHDNRKQTNNRKQEAGPRAGCAAATRALVMREAPGGHARRGVEGFLSRERSPVDRRDAVGRVLTVLAEQRSSGFVRGER